MWKIIFMLILMFKLLTASLDTLVWSEVLGMKTLCSVFCYITKTPRQRKSVSYEEILSVYSAAIAVMWFSVILVGQELGSSRCDRKKN